MWEWGKPDSTLFSPSHFPLSQSGEPSFLPQEVSCLEEGIQRAAPLLVVLSEPEICCQGWMGHGDLSHSILSILSAPNNVKVVAGSVFPRGDNSGVHSQPLPLQPLCFAAAGEEVS